MRIMGEFINPKANAYDFWGLILTQAVFCRYYENDRDYVLSTSLMLHDCGDAVSAKREFNRILIRTYDSDYTPLIKLTEDP